MLDLVSFLFSSLSREVSLPCAKIRKLGCQCEKFGCCCCAKLSSSFSFVTFCFSRPIKITNLRVTVPLNIPHFDQRSKPKLPSSESNFSVDNSARYNRFQLLSLINKNVNLLGLKSHNFFKT